MAQSRRRAISRPRSLGRTWIFLDGAFDSPRWRIGLARRTGRRWPPTLHCNNVSQEAHRGIHIWVPRAVPRLKCTFREVVEITEANGFAITPGRQSGSHRQYKRTVGKTVYLVTVAYHHINDMIP